MGRDARRTPLTLAVLSLLNECPRHPYEMQALIRERRIADVVRMRGGSLYDAVGRLAELGWVRPAGTGRAGARPQRTVYEITESGRAELFALLREYLGTREHEYPVFAAGLAHLGHLSEAEAAALLRARENELAALVEGTEEQLRTVLACGIPRAVLLETEYTQVRRRAELDWLRGVIADLAAGELRWTGLIEEET